MIKNNKFCLFKKNGNLPNDDSNNEEYNNNDNKKGKDGNKSIWLNFNLLKIKFYKNMIFLRIM